MSYRCESCGFIYGTYCDEYPSCPNCARLEKSQPRSFFMEPIQLTAAGDLLRPDHENNVHEESLIKDGIKWHGEKEKYTCCTIEVVPVSETHSRLVCKYCGTLLIISSKIKTYGDLRKACMGDIQERKNREIAISEAISQTARIG